MRPQSPPSGDQALYLVVKGVQIPLSELESLSPVDRALLLNYPEEDRARRDARRRRLETQRVIFSLIGLVVAGFIGSAWWWARDLSRATPPISDVPEGLRPIVALFPMAFAVAGAFFGAHLSPFTRMKLAGDDLGRRIERDRDEFRARETAKRTAQELAENETKWLKAARDALYWWAAHGSRLTSDPEYLAEYVRVKSDELRLRKGSILEEFRSADAPFATKDRADAIAEWIDSTHPDVLTEHSSDPALRSPGKLAQVFRAFHRRDVALLPEMEFYSHTRAAEHLPKRPLTVEERWEDAIKRYESLMEFRRREQEGILDRANNLPPSEREDYIRDQLRLLLTLIATEMKKRAEQ
jgi:hypothetical protein